jgi:hypothetical protein
MRGEKKRNTAERPFFFFSFLCVRTFYFKIVRSCAKWGGRGGWGERECKKRKKKRKMNEKKWVAVGLVTVITEERRVVGGWVEKKALSPFPSSFELRVCAVGPVAPGRIRALLESSHPEDHGFLALAWRLEKGDWGRVGVGNWGVRGEGAPLSPPLS